MDSVKLTPVSTPDKFGRLELFTPDGMKSRKYVRVLDNDGNVLGPQGFSKDSLWAVWKFVTSHKDPAVAIERIRQTCIAAQAGNAEKAVKSLGQF